MRSILFVATFFICFSINAQNLFTKNYSCPGDENLRCISTIDNGFLFLGSVDTGHVMLLMKVDSIGSIIWSKRYRFPYIEPAFAIQTKDSGFLIAAVGPSYSWVWGFGKPSVILIRTNTFGDTLWVENYESADNISVNSLVETQENIYVYTFGGSYQSGTEIHGIVGVDSIGNYLWTMESPIGKVNPSSTGGFILLYGQEVLKINQAGSVVEAHYYSGLDDCYATLSQPTPDGGNVISYLGQGYNVLMKIDSNASPVWAIKTQHWIDVIRVFPDGNIHIGGSHWFEKLDSAGNSIYSSAFTYNVFSQRNFLSSFDGMPALWGSDEILNHDDDIYLYKTDSIASNLCLSQTFYAPDSLFPLPTDSLINISSIMYPGGSSIWDYAPIPIQNSVYAETDGCIIANEQIIPTKSTISIYPNPANEFVNIQVPEQTYSITLFDISGHIVWNTETFNSDPQLIKINSISSGIYILEIITDKERLHRKIVFEN